MKTPRIVPVVACVTALLALRPCAVEADVPARRPPPPVPTAQAFLERVESNLRTLLSRLPGTGASRTRAAATDGGYGERQRADLERAFTDVEEALAFVASHPEANVLKAGPGPVPGAPAPFDDKINLLDWDNAAAEFQIFIDTVNETLDLLVNRVTTSRDFPAGITSGYPLGELDGWRTKLVGDIVQVGADTVAGADYVQGRGVVEPTAQAHLEAVQRAIGKARKELTTGYGSMPLLGSLPEIAQAVAQLDRIGADVTEALAYVGAHPEVNPLPPGPAPAGSSTVRPAPVPTTPDKIANDRSYQIVNTARRVALAVEPLNNALSRVVDDPSPDYRGPVMADLGDRRVRIMAEIGTATTEVLKALAAVETTPPDSVPARRSTQPPPPAPSAPQRPAALVNPRLLPSVFASFGLSLGFVLVGLGWFARKK